MDKVHVYTGSNPPRGNGNTSSDPHYRTYVSGQQSGSIDPSIRARDAYAAENDRSPLFATNVDTSVLGYHNGSGSFLGSCCILTVLCCHRAKEICGVLFCEESFEGRRMRPACRILIIIAGLCLAFTIGYAYALAFHNAPMMNQLVLHEKVLMTLRFLLSSSVSFLVSFY